MIVTMAAETTEKETYQVNKQLHHFIIDDVLGVINQKISIRRVQHLTISQQTHQFTCFLPDNVDMNLTQQPSMPL